MSSRSSTVAQIERQHLRSGEVKIGEPSGRERASNVTVA
jgi:hypothetical protein